MSVLDLLVAVDQLMTALVKMVCWKGLSSLPASLVVYAGYCWLSCGSIVLKLFESLQELLARLAFAAIDRLLVRAY
jgi:hypothetical protein